MIDQKYGRVIFDLMRESQRGMVCPPADEPCFCLRARDPYSTVAIRAYIQAVTDAGVNDAHVCESENALRVIQQWPERRMPG